MVPCLDILWVLLVSPVRCLERGMLARAPNPAGRWPVIVGWAFAAAFAGRPTGDSPAKGNRQREGEKEVTCAVEGSSSSWLNLAERLFR